MTVAEGNVGVAIGLVFGAGAATTIGASVVFFPKLVKRASRRVLASSLGLSAGVMIYVSFVEIFFKSIAGFVDADIDDDYAYIYATLSFFGGVLLMLIVDICVRHLSQDHTPRRRDIEEDLQIVWNEDEGCCEMNGQNEVEIISPHCVGCSHDPVRELEEWHEKAELELQANTQNNSVEEKERVTENENEDEEVSGESPTGIDHGDEEEKGTGNAQKEESPQKEIIHDQPKYEEESLEPVLLQVQGIPRSQEEDGFFRAPTRPNLNPKEEKKRLVKMGLSTALAIFIHNFPEGLATFVAALDDPSVGAVLAIAIGLHNIPEGLCVALPIYYATGNRWKAFMWGSLSGIAEPIAALLGWAVLANAMSDEVYAILFGLVSGMMVMISMKELIPTAHRYDPEDTVVTHSIIVGMAVIALSLVLFRL